MNPQTPGVYITETSLLPETIVASETAIPVFIGFTAMSRAGAVKINRFQEFEQLFGNAFPTKFRIITTANDLDLIPDRRFFLYDSVRLHFLNGGGACYVLSAGTFTDLAVTIDSQAIHSRLIDALSTLELLEEVTLVTMPDVHVQFDDQNSVVPQSLHTADYFSVLNQAIATSAQLGNKMVILDFLNSQMTAAEFRNGVAPSVADALACGAVYYPWLKSSMNETIGFERLHAPLNSQTPEETALLQIIADRNMLKSAFSGMQTIGSLNKSIQNLKLEVQQSFSKTKYSAVLKMCYDLVVSLSALALTDSVMVDRYNRIAADTRLIGVIKNLYRFKGISGTNLCTANGWNYPGSNSWFNQLGDQYQSGAEVEGDQGLLGSFIVPQNPNASDMLNSFKDVVGYEQLFGAIAVLCELAEMRFRDLEQRLFQMDPHYANAQIRMRSYLSSLPAQGAMTGIFSRVDRERGAWKSPANVVVSGIEKPVKEVTNAEQDELNIDPSTGKSINVIRTFTGKGPLVWGARTLAGNNPEWRYIHVRRFFNFAEKSISQALQRYVFEPNNARTWVKIKAVITGFMVAQWKAGALVGASMSEAFFVEIPEPGAAELVSGTITIRVGMAVARPAEFIVVEFSHSVKG